MILQHLRERTRERHHRLESRLDLLRALLSRERYRAILASFYGFYVPLEQLLGQVCESRAPELQFSHRRKVPLLVQDLTVLGLSPQEINDLPLCQALPTVTLFPQALGCLYVLEGATLGGQVISRNLSSAQGIHEQNGGAFFQSYGPQVGTMWRSFGIALTSYAREQDEDTIISAANETFASLETWLCDE